MVDDCYVQIDGGLFGPMSAGQLKELAEQGQIKADTPIRRGKDGEWIEAGRLRGLQELLTSSADSIIGDESAVNVINSFQDVQDNRDLKLNRKRLIPRFAILTAIAMLSIVAASVVAIWIGRDKEEQRDTAGKPQVKNSTPRSQQDDRIEEMAGYFGWNNETRKAVATSDPDSLQVHWNGYVLLKKIRLLRLIQFVEIVEPDRVKDFADAIRRNTDVTDHNLEFLRRARTARLAGDEDLAIELSHFATLVVLSAAKNQISERKKEVDAGERPQVDAEDKIALPKELEILEGVISDRDIKYIARGLGVTLEELEGDLKSIAKQPRSFVPEDLAGAYMDLAHSARMAYLHDRSKIRQREFYERLEKFKE